jgi:polyisoprenoid-binding protein YceI
VTRPVTVPVHLELAGGTMTATGRFSIKQTTYGMTPITVGGVVAVKDTLDIRFSITAQS